MTLRRSRSRPQITKKPPQPVSAVETAPVEVEVVPRPWTYEDYCAIPDDGYRYEVIGGKLYVAPAPNRPHQRATLQLATILNVFVQAHDLGEVDVAPFDVVLSRNNVVQPDIIYVQKERMGIFTNAGASGSPDLVIEILSPNTAAYDRSRKRDIYAAHGVPHYWILSAAAESLEAYELRDGIYVLVQRLTGDDIFSPGLFPGLSFSLGPLWR